MPIIAAVDIGSNSCRLKIASIHLHRLRTLHEDREVVRLGESVFATGLVSPEAMANTVAALKRFHKAVQAHAADQVRVVATSALRDARNAEAFTAWVKSATGWNVEIISGLEEGRLIHMGVVSHERGAKGRCLLVDLGGGSCEVTLSDGGRIRELVSLPLGAVRLQQEFLRSDPPAKEDIARLKQFISRELRRLERKIGLPKVSLVLATSGTALALAEASESFESSGWSAAKKPGKAGVRKQGTSAARHLMVFGRQHFASAEGVRKLANKLTRMTNLQRAAVPGIGPRRSEIIVGGAHVYAELLERLSLKGFRYSPLGLRDGVLAQMLAQMDLRTSAHQRMETERWTSVLEVCQRYQQEPRLVDPVRAHAIQLFDSLQRIHALPPEYKIWLQAAAMMHDVGKFMNHQGHHRHTHYIIANSEIYGFTPQERALVAAIARYLGKSRPTPMDREMRGVAPEEQTYIERAVVLLRLAMALNQDRASDVLRVKAMVYPRRVVLALTPGRSGAELEMWSLRKEADYFREVFRRELVAELA